MVSCERQTQWADLHMHSTASDGAHAPSHVIEMANARGLSVVSLTDHDTVAGLADAADAASRSGITFINGIEIDVAHRGGSMHILGYGFDRENDGLLTMIDNARQRRVDRNAAIVERLAELGINIRDDLHLDASSDQRSDRVPGRPDIAKALVRRGVVSDYRIAFRDFLGDGAKAWVPVELPTPRNAIDAIRQAGGVAVLAHPITLNCASDLELETVVAGLAHAGLAGIEVYHPAQNDGWMKRIERHAKRFDLVATGGSDFHAIRANEPRAAGFGIRIDARIVDALLARAPNLNKN
jgi:hypothetical protein